MMNKKFNKGLLLMLVVLFFSWSVYSIIPTYISAGTIAPDGNLYNGSINVSSNGLSIFYTNGINTNGSITNYTNASGFFWLNISVLRNATHGNYVGANFTFSLDHVIYGQAANLGINISGQNSSANVSSFNTTLTNSAALLLDGYYNISITVINLSLDGVWSGTGAVVSNGVATFFNHPFAYGFLIDNGAPRIASFALNITNNANVTNNRQINITAVVNDTIFTQSVIFGVTNSFRNSTQFNLTTTRDPSFNDTLFVAQLSTSTMTDGIYTVAIYANDSLKNNNVTVANLSFVLDRQGPNVTNLFLGNWTTGAYIGGDVAALGANTIVNITVEANDSLTLTNGQASNNYLAQVFFNISNSTGQINYTRAISNGSLWNASVVLNLSDSRYFPDGVYTVAAYANDSLNNYNRTTSLTFTIDRVAPSVAVSCTSNPTVGQTATCTCTVSDATSGLVTGYGFPGGKLTESTTASSVGTFTSSTCGATDNAGNSRSATGSWTTVASSSGSGGGSGGGGSGGGVSKGVVDQFEKKVWTSVNKGETASIAVKDGQIGVTGVEFTVAKATYGVTLQVEKVSTLPAAVKAVDKKVYKYVKITESNVDKALEGTAKVSFKVTQDWLKENGLQKENVVLYRYVGTEWIGLKTTVGEVEGSYQLYTAETPGFSYFAIGQGQAVVAPAAAKEVKKADGAKTEVKSEPVTEAAKTAVAAPATSTEKTADATGVTTKTTSGSGGLWVWIVFVLAIGVVIVVIYWWVKK